MISLRKPELSSYPSPLPSVARIHQYQIDEVLELFDTRQNFLTEQLDFLHHAAMVYAGLLEEKVNNPRAAPVMVRLYLLRDGVRPTYEAQRGGKTNYVSLSTA